MLVLLMYKGIMYLVCSKLDQYTECSLYFKGTVGRKL